MAFKTSHSSSRYSSKAEINIIPLVDVMLVLLIIFMVAAPMLSEGIDIDLPQVSASSVDMSEKDVILSIDPEGQIYIDDDKQKYSIVTIQDKLMALFKDNPQKTLFLRADQSIKYGYVVEVMAMARQAGIEKVGMITEAPEEEQPKTTKR